MASPATDIAERGVKTFMDTMREVGTDKAVSEALIGAGSGIGLNMAYNVASGDSGGYMGAGILGGAAGGFGRAGLKHFNLETQTSNLISTFKEGAVGQLTKAKTISKGESGSSVGQIMRHGKEEYSIPEYKSAEKAAKKQADLLNKKGYIPQAEEAMARHNALKTRRKELGARQFKNSGKTNPPEVKQGMTQAEINARRNSPEANILRKERKERANFRSSLDSNREAARARMDREASFRAHEQKMKGLSSPPKPQPLVSPTQPKKASNSNPATSGSTSEGRGADDKYYTAALDYMIDKGVVSTPGLQREFNIGYNRVSSMLDAFEADGFVSPANKNGKRKLLL